MCDLNSYLKLSEIPEEASFSTQKPSSMTIAN